MLRRLGIVLLPILLLSACGETALLVPELEPEDELTINTSDSGTIYQVDDGIPVSIQTSGAEGEEPLLDRLEVTLETIEGERIGRSTIEGEALQSGPVPEIAVPDVEPGEYRLLLVLFSEGGEIARAERRFFIAEGQYAVDGVTAFPPSFFPESSGILRVQLSVPEGADPYLRWTMDGSVLEEGYLSEGLDEVLVKSSSSEGVYPVLVEVFPTGPIDFEETGAGGSGSDVTEQRSFPFQSSARYTSQIVVRRTADLGEYDLAPEGSYYSLFHFMGNIRDDGARMELFDSAAPAQTIGTPDLRVTGGLFGYHLDGSAGFRVPEFILPVRDGGMSDFSVSARLLYLPEEGLPEEGLERVAEGDIFRAETADGDTQFRLSRHDDGSSSVYLSHDGQQDSVRSGILPGVPGEPQDIVVSVLPGEENTAVVWFIDGEFAWADSLSVAVEGGEAAADSADTVGSSGTDAWERRSGESVIGGESGIRAVIDEFGIYFRNEEAQPASDLTVFRKAQERVYGEDLVYAGGFESPDTGDELEQEGEVRIEAGDLVLQPGGSVSFPEFLFSRQDLILEIEARTPTESPDTTFDLSSLGTPATLLLTWYADGVARLPDATERFELLEIRDGVMRLRVRHEDGRVLIGDAQAAFPDQDAAGDEDMRPIERPVEDFEGMQLTVSQPSDSNVSFRIRSILAFSENSSLSRALARGGDDESSSTE